MFYNFSWNDKGDKIIDKINDYVEGGLKTIDIL